jgi:hypothetical protein
MRWIQLTTSCPPLCLQLKEKAKKHLAVQAGHAAAALGKLDMLTLWLAAQEFSEALSCLDLAIDLDSSSYKAGLPGCSAQAACHMAVTLPAPCAAVSAAHHCPWLLTRP